MSSLSTRTFVFQAMTPSGGKTFGVRAAPDEIKLADELRRDQLLLLKAWKLPMGATTGSAKLPLKDEALMNEQLQVLLSRGVPLVEALEVATSVVSTPSRGKIAKIREMVAAGTSFADACDKIGGFDHVTVAVYRSAERTGDLAGAAERLAKAARRRLGISGKALTVMIYPAVVSTVALLIFSGLLIFLVPTIAQQVRAMNEGKESSMNWFSQAVFSLGEWMRAHLGLLGLIIGVVLITVVLLWRPLMGALRRFGSRLPAVGDLLLTVELTRFFSVLAAMTRSGVTLADALAASTAVISNEKLREQLATLRQSLVDGGILRVLLERVDALPLATRRLLIAAERAGDLDAAFDSLSADMAAEVDKKSSRLLALLEPMVIVAMFGMLGPLIIAIAIPLMTFRSGD